MRGRNIFSWQKYHHSGMEGMEKRMISTRTKTPLEFKLVTSRDFKGEKWKKGARFSLAPSIKGQVMFDIK